MPRNVLQQRSISYTTKTHTQIGKNDADADIAQSYFCYIFCLVDFYIGPSVTPPLPLSLPPAALALLSVASRLRTEKQKEQTFSIKAVHFMWKMIGGSGKPKESGIDKRDGAGGGSNRSRKWVL